MSAPCAASGCSELRIISPAVDHRVAGASESRRAVICRVARHDLVDEAEPIVLALHRAAAGFNGGPAVVESESVR